MFKIFGNTIRIEYHKLFNNWHGANEDTLRNSIRLFKGIGNGFWRLALYNYKGEVHLFSIYINR